jgi:hypothetical protein
MGCDGSHAFSAWLFLAAEQFLWIGRVDQDENRNEMV